MHPVVLAIQLNESDSQEQACCVSFANSMSLALHNAARDGNFEELAKLIAQGGDLTRRDKLSRTPLHLAAWAGQLDCCKTLVAEGADKASAAQDDTTALHFACQKGHAEVVRFLLNEGMLVRNKALADMQFHL